MSRISLNLTDQQLAALRAAAGLDAEVLELRGEQLEERIAPSRILRGGLPGDVGDPSDADFTLQQAGTELDKLEETSEGVRSAFDASEGTDVHNIP